MNGKLLFPFLLITAVLIVTLVIATGATQGTRAAFITVAGTSVGNVVVIGAIAFGLSFVIRHAGELFGLLRRPA